MKKLLLIIALIIGTFGACNVTSPDPSFKIEDWTNHFDKICIDGHVYYHNGHMLAPKITDNGLPERCEKILRKIKKPSKED